MMTVHEVSKLAGVSIRTLQYYDKIGLLHPTGYTDADLERLQHILLFRELEFPLKDIKAIINSPDFDRSKLDEYSRQAKELYGSTPEYKEMEEKQKNRTEEDERF